MGMRQTWCRGIIALVGAAAMVAISGCGSASDRLTEELIERASGGEVEIDRDGERIIISDDEGGVVIDSDGETITFETDDGTAQFRSSGDLPAEWAAVIEVFPGAEVLGVFEFTEGDVKSQKVSMVIDDRLDQVLEFYDRTLTAAGFTETSRLASSSDGDGFAQIMYGRDDQSVVMIASDNDGSVDLSIALMG